MPAKGSLLWASKPAEMSITSGSNKSTFFKIFVSNIEEVYRIRTGEKGGQTLK